VHTPSENGTVVAHGPFCHGTAMPLRVKKEAGASEESARLGLD
jgi:hypothetical protein